MVEDEDVLSKVDYGATGRGYLATAWLLCGISLVVVSLRLYSRFTRKFVGFDDLFIAIGYIFAIVESSCITMQVLNGFTVRNIQPLSEHHAQVARKWTTLVRVFSFITLFFVRASVCIFVIRLLPRQRIWYLRTAFLAFGIIFATSLMISLAYTLQCKPFSSMWQAPTSTSCNSVSNFRTILTVGNSLGCTVDIICVLLPLLLVLPSRFTHSQKVQLVILFSLGLVPTGCAIGKVVVLWAAADSKFGSLAGGYCNICEIYSGIIVSCAPALRPLFVRFETELPELNIQPASPPHLHTSMLSSGGSNRLSVLSATRARISKMRSNLQTQTWPGTVLSISTIASSSSHIGNEKSGLSLSPSNSDFSDNTGGFASLIRGSTVVKRMDVEVERSTATPAEIAANAAWGGPLTDREIYCSWDDPPDDLENGGGLSPVLEEDSHCPTKATNRWNRAAKSSIRRISGSSASGNPRLEGNGHSANSAGSVGSGTSTSGNAPRRPSNKIRRATTAKAESVIPVPGCRNCEANLHHDCELGDPTPRTSISGSSWWGWPK